MHGGMNQANLFLLLSCHAHVSVHVKRYTGTMDLCLCIMVPSLLAELYACAFCFERNVKQSHQGFASFFYMLNSCELHLALDTHMVYCQ